MQTIRIAYPHSFNQAELPETVAAIGFFDGLHKGHQRVIDQAVEKAKQQKKESAVISFLPHPKVVLNRPTAPVKYITPIEEKEALLEEMGVDRLYLITFNKELSDLSPEEFIDHFIIGLHIDHLVAGFDFTFGHKGAGNMDNIATYSNGAFSHTCVDAVTSKNEKVSSTRIRNKLAKGEVKETAELLGRPYKTKGIVIKGNGRGRQLSFPTANLKSDDDKLLPKQGVYAVQIEHGNEVHDGMLNLGMKPTFKNKQNQVSVEVYIFDFEGDIYGEEMILSWHRYIREEKKFNGLEQLVGQLKKDEQTIRDYFA